MDPIIRTCSLFALSLALLSTPAEAKRETSSALGRYAQARMASAAGSSQFAANAFGAALTAEPSNPAVALRTYRQAVEVGDKMLALRAARALVTINALPVDGRLLLLSESFQRSDWRDAQVQIDKIEEAGTFAFLAPVLRAWLMQGAAQGDPLGALSVRSSDGLSAAYAQEHRGLLLLLRKDVDEGIASVNANRLSSFIESRNIQLRLAAAARLAELKRKPEALAMLSGEDEAMTTARAEVSAGRPLPFAISKPNSGMAMLLARVGNDLMRDNASPVALTFGRLAAFADPANVPAQLVLARALSANGNAAASVDTLNKLKAGPVGKAISDALRLDVLIEAERFDEAIAISKSRTNSSRATAADFVREGEVMSRKSDHLGAARAYTRAMDLITGPEKSAPVPWNLWLLLGREYDLAKDWTRAKPALRRAVELAPNEASALNHLGYAMLVNNEPIAEATAYIERAAKLRPDDPAITDSLGWAYFKGGRYDAAIAQLERASQSEPTIGEIGEHLGDAYWAVGRRVDARYAWNAALIQSDPEDASRLTDKIANGLRTGR